MSRLRPGRNVMAVNAASGEEFTTRVPGVVPALALPSVRPETVLARLEVTEGAVLRSLWDWDRAVLTVAGREAAPTWKYSGGCRSSSWTGGMCPVGALEVG